MALLATKRRVDFDRPALTTSNRCHAGMLRRVSVGMDELAQDILLALGVLAETHEAPPAVRRAIACLCLDTLGDHANVSGRELVDGLLDVRRAASADDE